MKHFMEWFRKIIQHKQIINITVFAFCLLMGGLLNLFTKDQAVSDRENRALAQLPEFQRDKFFSGEYFTEYEDYFADQFFSRDFFAGFSNDFQSLMGLPGAQEVQIVKAEGFNAFEQHAAISPDEQENDTAIGFPAEGAENTSEEQSTLLQNDKQDKALESSLNSGTDKEPAGNDSSASGISATDTLTGETASNADKVSNPTVASDNAQEAALPVKASETGGTPVDPAVTISVAPTGTAQARADTGPSPTDKPAQEDNGKTIGKVLIYKDSAYALFPFSEDSGNYYANTLNQFRKEAGDGVKIYSMLAPTSMEFLQEKKFQELTDSQRDAIDYVNARLKSVTPVDAYSPIEEHKSEYVYFRTDHHWTALGAYYAYTGFAGAAGFEPVSLDRYETDTIEDYIGSMYETTGSSNLKRNPDTITVYKPFTKNEYNVYYGSATKMKVIDMSHADKKIKYRVFLSGDRPLGIIKTDVANGKKVLVIKDSYGNAMVPFLLPHYEEIYVVDPRQYEKNIFSLIQNNGIQEVLFLNYVPILSYYGYIDLIVKVMEAEGK